MGNATPGPWRHIGTGIEAKAFDGSWKWLTPVVHGGSPEQASANRALMAAAPDLLDSLKAVSQALNMTRVLMRTDETRLLAGQLVADAAAVIAKAEGR